MGGVKQVKIDNGTLKQVMAILVDPTASIQAAFWEEWIDSIEDGKTCIHKHEGTRRWLHQ